MTTFQYNNHKEIFDIWIKFYQIPSNTCDDMIKYLYLIYEVTLKNFKQNEIYYIKLLGDNMKGIIEDYVFRSATKTDFDLLKELINEWHRKRIYDSFFIILDILKPLEKFEKQKFGIVEKVEVKVTDKDLEDYNKVLKNHMLSKILVSEVNSSVIK